MASIKVLDSPESYTIAWIAALPIERAAAEAMLDEEHATPTGFTRHQTDTNVYTWGRVGEHNIVIAALASGVYGTTSAATTASSLLASLPSIRIGLLVGIGGGVARPDQDQDIRLGDIVVSQPCNTTGGVCQYDLIKANSGGKCERKGFLGRPPTVLLNALTSIQSRHERKDSEIPYHLQMMLESNPKMGKRTKKNPGFIHQGFDNDRLFKASCDHIPGPDCQRCNTADEIDRDPRDTTDPDIHYGTIGSGNTLVKDATTRDRIVADLGEDFICFEMEAAGLMNYFPCLVIRGICDYADSHKNIRWQRYASATAAAYTKELLAYMPTIEVQKTKRAQEVLQLARQQVDGIQRTAVATKATADSIKSDLHTDWIRSWLSPPDPSTNANHARKLRHEGTGTWLLENPVFQSWHSGSHQYIWLYGLAGCGKTVLSATVLDHLTSRNDALILSFFFDFSDITKQTLEGMLRSLAFQLYQNGTSSAVHLDSLFQEHQNGINRCATKALSDTVLSMLAAQKKVFVVLDAIDESTTSNEVLLWIEGIVSRPELIHVQLLCTSRPESEFLQHIPPLIEKQICLSFDKQTINTDIRSWVTAQLSQRHSFIEKRLSHGLLERIRSKVAGGADGLFRWAFCQLDSLAQCRHEAAIEKALLSLPLNLNETYQRMLRSIPTGLRNDAMRLLQFLVHSKRPLKLVEAKEIIATKIENESKGFDVKRRLFRETDVLDYCPGLATVIHATDKELHLAHFSVKEFLLTKNGFGTTTASISITMTCSTYLTNINCSNETMVEKYPMARYAAELWSDYVVLAQTSEDIVRMTIRFLQDESTFQRWTYLYLPDRFQDGRPRPPQGSRLYYACFIGLVASAQYLISKGADVNEQGGLYGNALQAASGRGYQHIVKLLLDQGAYINAQGGLYGNALQAASANGYHEIVKLLLGQGADVNLQGGEYGSALQAASANSCHKIVKLLLEKGTDINLQGGEYGSALQTASANGCHEIVELLLQNGADVNEQDSLYGSALQAASANGYHKIVKLLLQNGADVNEQDCLYGSALQAASANGYHKIVKLLLQNGADVNEQDGLYGNALQAASANGYHEIVELLLQNGADVNLQGGEYGNALQSRLDTDNPTPNEKHLSTQDKLVGRSMETDIPLLSKSGSYTAETGKKQTRNLDHILNPTLYYQRLDTLEIDTAIICGLDSGPPDAHSQRDFRDGFRKVNSALINLRTEGFCGRMMSILIEDPVRSNIARAIHICPQDLDDPGTSAWVEEILQEICGDRGLLDDVLPGPEDSRYSFLATTLLVGLVSFSGSHVCPFDVNVWRKSVSEIPVGFGFSFRRRELACLKNFIGGPAWVLGRPRVKIEGIGVKVSLTVQDLQELWGPVWLVGGSREKGPIIRTERGFVVPLPRHQQSDVTGEEIECHWTETCPQYVDAPNPIMLSNTSKVLLGTNIGLSINSECPNHIGDIQDHFANQLQLPGACNHYYITDGYDVQLIGGQYVTGGIVGKRKRIPATTLKAALISEILDPELDVTPLLKMNIGLEISACTGNARRLSLWRTLYLSQKRQRPHEPADCRHGIGNIECIEQCWKQSCSSRSTAGIRCFGCGVANTTAAPRAGTSLKNGISNNNVSRSRIVSAIMTLQHTGLDPEGNLQAYWPFVETRMTRRIQPSRSSKWFNIIADTRDSATFAVTSYHCLEFQGERSLTCCPNGYRDPLQKTCLSICITQQPVIVTERGFRRNLGLSTSLPESYLANMSVGALFCVAGTQLYVKEILYGQQKAIVAYTVSKFSQIVKWTRFPMFLEHLNPEVGKPVEVVIYKK